MQKIIFYSERIKKYQKCPALQICAYKACTKTILWWFEDYMLLLGSRKKLILSNFFYLFNLAF